MRPLRKRHPLSFPESVEPEVEKAVVINIAIKLSKAYLGDNDYKFVNAILDKVLVREDA